MQWFRWPTPGLFTCLIWDWLLVLGVFVRVYIELSAFCSKIAIPVPVGDHLKQLPLGFFLCSCDSFLSRYPRPSETQSVSVPWKVCGCLQEQTQCAAKSSSEDFWSGWFGAILQCSLCPCKCCASLIRYCCCLEFLCSFQETGKGQIQLSCESTLLTCQELCRMYRSTEVNPNSSSCWLNLIYK